MISDILSDALREIEWYQESRKYMYDDLTPDIEECKTAMRTLLIKLDTVPQIKKQSETGKALIVGAVIAGGAFLLSKFAPEKDEPVKAV